MSTMVTILKWCDYKEMNYVLSAVSWILCMLQHTAGKCYYPRKQELEELRMF